MLGNCTFRPGSDRAARRIHDRDYRGNGDSSIWQKTRKNIGVLCLVGGRSIIHEVPPRASPCAERRNYESSLRETASGSRKTFSRLPRGRTLRFFFLLQTSRKSEQSETLYTRNEASTDWSRGADLYATFACTFSDSGDCVCTVLVIAMRCTLLSPF